MVEKIMLEIIDIVNNEIAQIKNDEIADEIEGILSIWEEKEIIRLSPTDIINIDRKFQNIQQITEEKKACLTDILSIKKISTLWKKGIKANSLILHHFGDLPTYDKEDSKPHHAIDIFINVLGSKSYEEIVRLCNWENKKGVLLEMEKCLKEVLARKYEREKDNISNHEDLRDKMIKELREKFPTLGNNKFNKIKSKQSKEDIQNNFKAYGMEEIVDAVIAGVKKKTQAFSNTMDVVYSSTHRIESMFKGEVIITGFYHFAAEYLSIELENAARRKENIATPKKESPKEPDRKIQLNYDIQNSTESEGISTIISFLEEIFAESKTKKDMIKKIIRLYSNGKNIRILDLVADYGIDPEIFTPKLRSDAEKLGLFFEENGKEIITEEKEIEKNNKEDEGILEKTEPTKIDIIKQEIKEYLDSKEKRDGETAAKILHLAGHSFINRKGFVKEFNDLYLGETAQRKAIIELQNEIHNLHCKPNQRTKKPYRSINFKNNNRILLLVRNEIDGIYSHSNYMKRLNSQK